MTNDNDIPARYADLSPEERRLVDKAMERLCAGASRDVVQRDLDREIAALRGRQDHQPAA